MTEDCFLLNNNIWEQHRVADGPSSTSSSFRGTVWSRLTVWMCSVIAKVGKLSRNGCTLIPKVSPRSHTYYSHSHIHWPMLAAWPLSSKRQGNAVPLFGWIENQRYVVNDVNACHTRNKVYLNMLEYFVISDPCKICVKCQYSYLKWFKYIFLKKFLQLLNWV